MPAPIYVTNSDPNLFVVRYEDGGNAATRATLEAKWKHFNRLDPATQQTFYIWYRPTARKMEARVDHRMPPDALAGRYRVETFVPGKHATTRKALFTVANKFVAGAGGPPSYEDTVVMINQYDIYDQWVSLGEYDLDPIKDPMSGRVRQYDLSLEDPAVEVSFGPVRWIPLFSLPTNTPRFDPPIGTQSEREGPFGLGAPTFGAYPTWVGKWFDINPYLSWYSLGYHTGADLNLPGGSDADKGKPIYAIGDGTVTYAGAAGSWGYIVVIEHPDALVTLPNGQAKRQKVYSRYGHVESKILVKKGDTVTRGQMLATVGLPAGQVTGWHLHFDMCYTEKFKSQPSHWPNMTKIRELQKAGVSPNSSEFKKAQAVVMQEVLAHYLDPFRFFKDNHS